MQDLHKWFKKNVEIIYSPFQEFLLSLHVLSRPEYHLSRYDWAKAQLERLPSDITDDLSDFKLLTSEFLTVMDMVKPWDHSANLSIEAGLERVKKLPILEWISVLLEEQYSLDKINQWMNSTKDKSFDELKPEIKEMIMKPKYTKKKLLDFLYHYLDFFKEEQKRIEPWMIKAVHEAQIQLGEDPITFMKGLHPRFVVEKDYVLFHKAKTYQYSYQEIERIYILPSTFIEPHLLLGAYDQRISIALPVQIPSHELKNNIPDDFIKIMKALSDKTRAGILKMLLEHSYCIQQLADIFHISEAAISKHLRILSEVDLIWSERRGHYVFYKGIPSRLDMLTVEIHQFMDMKNPFTFEGGNE